MKRRFLMASIALSSMGAVFLAPAFSEGSGLLKRKGNKGVRRQESYTYNESVPVTKQVPRTETYYTTVQKAVPYTYTVNEMVTEAVKQTRTVYRVVSKEVPYTYVESVPVTTNQKQT